MEKMQQITFSFGPIPVKHVLKEQFQSEEQQNKIFLEQVLLEDLEENQEVFGETRQGPVTR